MRDKKNLAEKFFAAMVFALVPLLARAETQGEALFKENKAQDSIPALEKDIAAGDAASGAYNFLGLAYYQTGDYEKSIDAFERGMKIEGAEIWALCYNAGNSAFAAGDYIRAEEYYSRAIRAKDDFDAPYLNRANARLKGKNLEGARADYDAYITRFPESPQAESIKALIQALDDEIERTTPRPERLGSAEAVMRADVLPPIETERVETYFEPREDVGAADAEALEKSAALITERSAVAAAAELESLSKEDAAPREEPPAPVAGAEEGKEGQEAPPEKMETDAALKPVRERGAKIQSEEVSREEAVMRAGKAERSSSEKVEGDALAKPRRRADETESAAVEKIDGGFSESKKSEKAAAMPSQADAK